MAPEDNPRKSLSTQRIGRLFVIVLLIGAVVVEMAAPVVAWQWQQRPFPGLLLEQTLVVTGVGSEDWAGDVPRHDLVRLIAVAGQPVGNSEAVQQALRGVPSGETVTVTFQPQGGSGPIQALAVVQPFPLQDWLVLFWLPYATGLIYLVVGIWVFRHRGDRRAGRTFALFCAAVALATGTFFDLNTSHHFVRIWTAAMAFVGALLVDLGLVFPEQRRRIAETRYGPLLRFAPYLVAIALAVVAEVRLYDAADPWAYITAWRWIYVALGLAVLTFFGLMLYTRARTVSGIVRQQVRLVLVGGVLAFSPMAVYMIVAGFGFPISFNSVIYMPPLVIFPIFVAFAILRYKLLGMDLVMSRGLAYAFLTAIGAAAYFLALIILGNTLDLTAAETLEQESLRSLPWLLALLVAILFLALSPLRQTTERLVDRLLGRPHVDYRQGLQAFSRELLTTPLEIPAILKRLLVRVEPISHAAPTFVFLYDPGLAAYTLRLASGFVAADDDEICFGGESDLARHLAEREDPLYLLEAEAQTMVGGFAPGERQKIETLGLALFFPLRGRAQLEGWVALGPRLSGEPYSPDDLAFLTALVDQSAIALENARLLAEARHRAEELEALQETAIDISVQQETPLLLQSVVERATRLLDASGGGVFLVEDEGQRLRMVVSYNLGHDYAGVVLQPGEGVAGHVVERGRPVRVKNYGQFAGRSAHFADAPVRSVLGVPLKWQDEVIGVLNVADTSRTRLFTREDEWLLSLLASQAAIALRNAQLFADLQQRMVHVDVLRQISEAVDLRRDLEDLLGLIYSQVSRVLEIDNFYTALYDEVRKEFRMAFYVEERERREPPNPRWPLGEGLTSQIVRQRAPIVTDNYLAECERRGVAHSGKPAKAWLGAPLLSGDRVLGVLNVSSFQPDYRFSPEQVQVLTAIADQAALAMDRMRLYQEMEARAAELATLNEVSVTINSSLDLSNVLDLIMNKVVDLLDVEAASLLLVDEETDDLVFEVALRGTDHQLLAGLRLPMGVGIVGQVAQTGETLIVNDVRSDPRWNPHVDEDTGFVTHSILCVPMISREKVIGVIEVINHRDGSPFTEGEASLLTGFAAQAAVAIENARLYTQTDQALARRVEDLSTMQRVDRELNTTLDFDRVMDMTLDWALRGVGAPVGVIALYEEERQGLFLLATRGYPPEYEHYRTELWPLEKGVVGRVIRSGEPALVANVARDPDYHPAQAATRSQLTVPIKHSIAERDRVDDREERVIGVVSVESEALDAFGPDELGFLQRLADHAAIAMENARLYRETKRRAEEMALLYDIGLTVSSHLALEEVLESVYQQIVDVWDPPVFYVALYEEDDDGVLSFPIYVDRGERLGPFRQDVDEQAGFSAWIVRNRQPILVRDWEKESETSPVQGVVVGDVSRSWLGVPLIVGDRIVGVMSVQDYVPNAYGEEHQRFLTTIASEVAVAIENARLHAETQKRLREQTALREAGAVISSALDPATVLHRIAQQMGQAIDATSAYICSHDAETMTSVVLAEYIGPKARKEERVSDLGQTYVEDEDDFLETLRAGGHDVSHAGDLNLSEFEQDHMHEYGVKSILYIPLRLRGQLIGYVELWESRRRREFTPDEIGLCQGIAQQAAIAIENARLYEGVREANQAKSEFIDFVAHELKQPMTAMQGYAKMLTMGIGGELTDMQQEFVQVINSNVDRMGKLVNDLLEISRLEAGRIQLKLAEVRLQEVVDEAVTNTRTEIEARHHTLELDVPGDLPPVRGDRERLVQVLTNLVSNAYKYTPEGGTISITANGRDDAETPPGHLSVSVSDTGIGMTPQDIANLDEKFYRADHELVREQPGTGLGVSITRNLVELHGGEFLVESTPGEGTTFRFTVPIAE